MTISRGPGLGEDADLASPAFYDNACKPFGEASMLPPAVYSSKSFADLEDEKLWTRCWVCVGSASQIPNPGDLLPFTVGNHGIHVQREADGSFTGRFNKAQHGGCRFVPLQCQTGKKTKCSYTSCGFSRDRDVILAAELEDAHRLSNQYLGDRPERLLKIRVASLGPLLFVNLDPAAEPFSSSAASLAAGLEPWLRSTLVDSAGRWLELTCNWKALGRAFMGARHAMAGGGGGFAMVGMPVDQGGAAGTLCWAFPNLLLGLMPDHAASIVLQPTALDQVMARLRIYVDARASRSPDLLAVVGGLEDFWLDRLRRAAEAARAALALLGSSGNMDAPAAPLGREESSSGYDFQRFLVGAILAPTAHEGPAPAGSPSGR